MPEERKREGDKAVVSPSTVKMELGAGFETHGLGIEHGSGEALKERTPPGTRFFLHRNAFYDHPLSAESARKIRRSILRGNDHRANIPLANKERNDVGRENVPGDKRVKAGDENGFHCCFRHTAMTETPKGKRTRGSSIRSKENTR